MQTPFETITTTTTPGAWYASAPVLNSPDWYAVEVGTRESVIAQVYGNDVNEAVANARLIAAAPALLAALTKARAYIAQSPNKAPYDSAGQMLIATWPAIHLALTGETS